MRTEDSRKCLFQTCEALSCFTGAGYAPGRLRLRTSVKTLAEKAARKRCLQKGQNSLALVPPCARWVCLFLSASPQIHCGSKDWWWASGPIKDCASDGFLANGLSSPLRSVKQGKTHRVVHSRTSGVIPVRRTTGVLLLLLLTSPLVTPLFAGNPRADLPACCRRNGKHHCAEQMRMPPSEGAQFASAGMKCPMFPVGLATLGHSPQILSTTSQYFYGAIVSHPAIHAQAEISYRVCWSRSQQKRGPPVLA